MNNDYIKQYACNMHDNTNHKYDGDKPYSTHLQMVYDYAIKYIHLIPEEDRNDVLSATWCHDLIEDCRVTYNDLKKVTNQQVAEIVYACTNEKGKNRAERANDKYYSGIMNTRYAVFVKLCDRLANVQYSKNSGNGMFNKYKKEQFMFKSKLYTSNYIQMMDDLDTILN